MQAQQVEKNHPYPQPAHGAQNYIPATTFASFFLSVQMVCYLEPAQYG